MYSLPIVYVSCRQGLSPTWSTCHQEQLQLRSWHATVLYVTWPWLRRPLAVLYHTFRPVQNEAYFTEHRADSKTHYLLLMRALCALHLLDDEMLPHLVPTSYRHVGKGSSASQSI